MRSFNRHAFTLVELLVVVGVITLLLGFLLPVMTTARSQARATSCLNNIRQVGAAVYLYAADSKGKFPVNLDSPAPGRYWSNDDQVPRYLPIAKKGFPHPTAYVCPEDDGARRSYAMNIWGSSKIDKPIKTYLWTTDSGGATVILIAEAWSGNGPQSAGWEANPTIGYMGADDSQRFGANGGLSPPITAGRFHQVNCELPFVRHRVPSRVNLGNQPHGRVTICFGDGHAELLADTDLVDSSGNISGRALWTPQP